MGRAMISKSSSSASAAAPVVVVMSMVSTASAAGILVESCALWKPLECEFMSILWLLVASDLTSLSALQSVSTETSSGTVLVVRGEVVGEMTSCMSFKFMIMRGLTAQEWVATTGVVTFFWTRAAARLALRALESGIVSMCIDFWGFCKKLATKGRIEVALCSVRGQSSKAEVRLFFVCLTKRVFRKSGWDCIFWYLYTPDRTAPGVKDVVAGTSRGLS